MSRNGRTLDGDARVLLLDFHVHCQRVVASVHVDHVAEFQVIGIQHRLDRRLRTGREEAVVRVIADGGRVFVAGEVRVVDVIGMNRFCDHQRIVAVVGDCGVRIVRDPHMIIGDISFPVG